MRQRVAIARAFATEPRILFLDEPFSALDALTRATLQQVLVKLCSDVGNSATAIMITNNLDEALLLSDQIVPMTRGPRAKLGTPIPVKIAKPRTVESLVHDPLAVRTRAEVVERLAEFVHTRQQPPKPATRSTAQHEAVAEEQLGPRRMLFASIACRPRAVRHQRADDRRVGWGTRNLNLSLYFNDV